jgi:hypothetical protein
MDLSFLAWRCPSPATLDPVAGWLLDDGAGVDREGYTGDVPSLV